MAVSIKGEKSCQDNTSRKEAKQMILQAALNIGLEEGNENVTVRRIGERIGYSTGVIYYHFKDKQDILDELARQLDREAYETVKSFIDMDKPVKEALKGLYLSIADLAENSPSDYKRLFTNRRNYGRSHTVWTGLIKELMDIAVERGELRIKDTAIASTCLLSYIIGSNILFVELKSGVAGSSKDYADRVVDVILDGLMNAGI